MNEPSTAPLSAAPEDVLVSPAVLEQRLLTEVERLIEKLRAVQPGYEPQEAPFTPVPAGLEVVLEDLMRKLAQFESTRQAIEAGHLNWEAAARKHLADLERHQKEIASLLLGFKCDREANNVAHEALETQPDRSQQERSIVSNTEALLEQRGAGFEELRAAEASRQMLAPRDETESLRLEALRQEIAEAQCALESRETHLARSESELSARAAQVEQLRGQLEERLAAAELEIQREREQLSQLRQELLAQRDDIDRAVQHQEEQINEIERLRNLLADERCDLQVERKALEQLRSELASSTSPAQCLSLGGANRPEPTSACSPDSATDDDVFQRLQAAGIWKTEPGEDRVGAGQVNGGLPEQHNYEPATSATHVESKPAHDEEESIDQYMAKLLERARQNTGTANDKPSAPSAAGARSARQSEPAGNSARPEIAKPDALGDTSAAQRRRQRPSSLEITRDLSAMRELANLSARSALDTHYRRQQQHLFGTKVLIFFISLAAAVFGFVLNGFTPRTLVWYGSLAALAVSAIWAAQLAVIFIRIKRAKDRSNQQGQIDDQPEDGNLPCPADESSESAAIGLRALVQ